MMWHAKKRHAKSQFRKDRENAGMRKANKEMKMETAVGS